MNYKVHWIIDGLVNIEADTKEEAEKKIQEELESYVKNSDKLKKTINASENFAFLYREIPFL